MHQFDILDKILSSNLPVYVISCGFRCYTRPDLRKNGITAKSGPFDNGFFPPNVIYPMLMDKNIVFDSDTISYAIAKPSAPEIKFKTATREEINEQMSSECLRANDDGFELIDGAGGYFIRTSKYNSIMCHYLTYKATAEAHILNQINKLQDIMRRRLSRINDICMDDTIFKLFVYRDINGFTGYTMDDNRVDISPTSKLFDDMSKKLSHAYNNTGVACFHKLADATCINEHHEMYSDELWREFVSETKQRLNIVL